MYYNERNTERINLTCITGISYFILSIGGDGPGPVLFLLRYMSNDGWEWFKKGL